jgi:hypothetical protein
MFFAEAGLQGFPPWGLIRAPAAGAMVLCGWGLSLPEPQTRLDMKADEEGGPASSGISSEKQEMFCFLKQSRELVTLGNTLGVFC